MVVECKRKQVLNAYENKEFSTIRELFATLCAQKEELALAGELAIDFRREIVDLPVNEIVQAIRAMTKSLSLYNTKETEWGSIHLKPVEVSMNFEPTRLYSPEYLERVLALT